MQNENFYIFSIRWEKHIQNLQKVFLGKMNPS